MKTIYIIPFNDDETGEIQVAFDENGKYLHWWSMNDAHYRDEYMGPLFLEVGLNIHTYHENQFKWLKRAIKEKHVQIY
jgi:hypothetical protein